RPLLSGNKFYAIVLLISVAAASCTPRAKVLRPGSVQADEAEAPVVIDDREKPEDAPVAEAQQIALLLPFQLNRSAGNNPTEADIKRAALALDFYQGF